MKTNLNHLNRACDGRIIATFGKAQLVQRLDGRHELRGGSAADHTATKEWVSLFLHEAVVSRPPPAARRRGLSGLARSVSEYCGSLGSISLVRRWVGARFGSLTGNTGDSLSRTPKR